MDDIGAGPAVVTATVLLVEDHELLAESLAAALRGDGIPALRPPGLDPGSVLEAVSEHRPAVVLLDLGLGEHTSALPMIRPITDLGAAVVMCTAETDRVRLAECVEAGAIGIVPKSESFDHLVAALHEALELRSLLDARQREDLLAELRRQRAEDERRLAPFRALTAREQSVLAALVEGHSAEEIAAGHVVSLATVRTQIRSVLQKLGVHSQLAAVAAARAAGWQPGAPA